MRLVATDEGGRSTPLRSGYRAIVRVGKAEAEPAWGVEMTLDDPTSQLAPGESRVVRLSAWADPPPPSVGTAIYLYEGAKLDGRGVVRE